MVRAVCFDLDGTLFDDRQYVRAGLREAARVVEAETGVAVEEELLDAYFRREIQEETFDHVLAEKDLPVELVPDLVDAYHDHDADLDPYPEVRAVLDRLDDRYDLGLLTGGTNGRTKLDRLGLAEYFDAVVVAPARDLTKRETESFRILLDSLGVEASETVYVGDRPSVDFPIPNDLGMTTVRVAVGRYAEVPPETPGETPDVTVEDLQDLPEVISAIR